MDPLYIPIVAILMPLILVPTILVMKFRYQKRKWEHLERLKAMETQFPVSPRQALGGARGVSSIGAGVPAVSVLGALLTTLLWEPMQPGDSVAVPAIAWGCAFLISALAMGTSLKLASMHRQTLQEAEYSSALGNGKAVYDPDAFDVVSSRA